MRCNNRGRPEQYRDFLEACQNYMQGKIETATDDRRHDTVASDAEGNNESVTHLATAISSPDLHRQVACTLPEELLR